MGKVIDLTGQKFGRLTVIEYRGIKNTFAQWLCKCDCGNSVEVIGRSLRTGNTRSCGCLCRELSTERLLKRNSNSVVVLGHTRLKTIWRAMLQRCDNPSYKSYNIYGGRGIKVCNEWREFANFMEWAITNGYNENAPRGECTIDRIDCDGNYEPSNCRWVSTREQNQNRRTPVQKFSYKGVTHTLPEWSNIVGMDVKVIRERLRMGWSMRRALYTPKLK